MLRFYLIKRCENWVVVCLSIRKTDLIGETSDIYIIIENWNNAKNIFSNLFLNKIDQFCWILFYFFCIIKNYWWIIHVFLSFELLVFYPNLSYLCMISNMYSQQQMAPMPQQQQKPTIQKVHIRQTIFFSIIHLLSFPVTWWQFSANINDHRLTIQRKTNRMPWVGHEFQQLPS